MSSFKYLVVYFFIMLLLPKTLSYFDNTEELYIYASHMAALLLSYKYVKHSGLIPISMMVYMTLFSIDWLSGFNFITSDKTESFVFGVGASLVFVFPMAIGLLIRRAIENVTRQSR